MLVIAIFVFAFTNSVNAYDRVFHEDCEYTDYINHFMERNYGSGSQTYWDIMVDSMEQSSTNPHGGNYSMTYQPWIIRNPHTVIGLGDSSVPQGNLNNIDLESINSRYWYFRWYQRWEPAEEYVSALNKMIYINYSNAGLGTFTYVWTKKPYNPSGDYNSMRAQVKCNDNYSIDCPGWNDPSHAPKVDDNQWHRLEIYIDTGTSGGLNAKTILKVDGVVLSRKDNFSFTESGNIDINPIKFISGWPSNVAGPDPVFSQRTWLDDLEIYTLDGPDDIPIDPYISEICTESDWIYTDTICQPNNEIIREWTLNALCQGGIFHSRIEKLPCQYIEADKILNERIISSSDDAEEQIDNGHRVFLGSSDLEMIIDHNYTQEVGLRFPNLNIPSGATIARAHLEFTSCQNDASDVDLIINTELVDNSLTFTTADYNISGRTKSTNFVLWDNTSEWLTDGTYQSPDLSNIIQEVVDRNGWAEGNAISFIISGNKGSKRVYSYDGGGGNVPLLHVEFAVDLPHVRADVNQDGNINITDAQLTLRQTLGLDMTSTDWQTTTTTGDVNCDNTTNSTDAQLILRYSLGLDMTGTGWCIH
jgi:hypothetical protein